MTKPRWWTVRPAQNRRPATYTCPFCRRYLPALTPHALVAPEGDTSKRRHAHTKCVMAARKAGRLPTRDEWQATQPKPERTGLMARLFGRRGPTAGR